MGIAMKPVSLKPFARIVLALALACATLFPVPATSAEATAENPDSGKPFANVWRLRGDVAVTDKDGASRKLSEGGTV